MDILTVHYNTPEMMECMIRSVNKHTECTIHVLDNSDEYPFESTFDNVEVIDNTKGQYINFDEFLSHYPNKRSTPRSNFGSAKHCKTVDICFDLLPNGFILMDSDVLVKKDISAFWDERYAWVGEPLFEKHDRRYVGVSDYPDESMYVMRLLPFLCYVNVPMCRKHGIRYFNEDWMWFLKPKDPNRVYDTGAWFLKDCMDKGMPGKMKKITPYIEHYNHGSHEFRNETLPDWLNEHKELWR